MADSDDEFERRKGRDKFRRERNDYDRRNDDRRRDSWEDRRPAARGGQQRGWRGNSGGMRRDMWSNRGSNFRDRRDAYSRTYDDNRRDRLSPGRYDPNPAKRMRRDWDDSGFPSMYDSPFQVSNGPPGADRAGRNYRGMDASSVPLDHFGFMERRDNGDCDYQTQPAMMTFKQFLSKQDDTISQEDAIKLYGDYQLEFKRQRINEFFLAHRDEEWFKSKYHPEECEKKQTEVKLALQARRKVFESLKEKEFFCGVSVDVEFTEKLVKILDATVILLEGGNDLDLTILNDPLEVSGDGSRHNSESFVPLANSEKKADKEDEEDGELSDSNDKMDGDEKDADQEKTEKTKDLALEMTISPEQEELKKKAMEYQKQQEAAAAEAKAQRRKKKNVKKRSDYSYESNSESGSDSDSDTEPAPPGLEDDQSQPDVLPVKSEKDSPISENNNKTVEKDNPDVEIKESTTETEQKPRPLHRTNSIFLRNLAPHITKQEIEALCRRFLGFKRVALQDPQPERRFLRRGWVTFSNETNIKEVCWSLSNIRLRDSELGATLNRELKQRIRAANGITVHKQVMRSDIKIAAKMIQILDKKYSLWEEPGEEKKDEEKESQFCFVSKNPVLKNITDYLVEEGSFEEDELIGDSGEERKDANTEVAVEKDESLSQALDQMVLYLRLVHSIDYYSANEYPSEDEMPHRCGIMHARGTPPGSSARISQNDVSEWITSFEKKIKPFMETSNKISDTDALQLGKKDPDVEVEKFVQANTQELSKDKWLCSLSGKKFKGPDFVRKHIFNKHEGKVEEVKQEVKFFNNYLLDPKRPSLPEHPSNRPKPAPTPQPLGTEQHHGDSYGSYPPTGSMGGYRSARPPTYGGGGYQNPYPVRDTRPPPEAFRRSNIGGGAPFNRSDPRQLIQYTDLDAPDDGSTHK